MIDFGGHFYTWPSTDFPNHLFPSRNRICVSAGKQLFDLASTICFSEGCGLNIVIDFGKFVDTLFAFITIWMFRTMHSALKKSERLAFFIYLNNIYPTDATGTCIGWFKSSSVSGCWALSPVEFVALSIISTFRIFLNEPSLCYDKINKPQWICV